MAFSFLKSKKNKTTDTVDAIIKDIENTPVGISENNVLFAGLNELGGYFFFQTVIVGLFSIKTANGATLTFKGENNTLELKSDMLELESDPTNIKGRHITKIDFQVEEKDIKTLENSRMTSMELMVKKETILFTKFAGDGDEEE